jgi:hypothetical protein
MNEPTQSSTSKASLTDTGENDLDQKTATAPIDHTEKRGVKSNETTRKHSTTDIMFREVSYSTTHLNEQYTPAPIQHGYTLTSQCYSRDIKHTSHATGHEAVVDLSSVLLLGFQQHRAVQESDQQISTQTERMIKEEEMINQQISLKQSE